MPKLLYWEDNGLTYASKSFALVGKSVSHPPIDSVRLMQVENRKVSRVSKQIESAVGKGWVIHCESVTGGFHMFAVGIDVSNGKSMVAVLQSATKTVFKPFEVAHTAESLAGLVEKLNGLDGEKRIVMEHTGRYYEAVAMYLHNAGFFVSAINPLVLQNYQDGISVRKVKTDKADAMKIARFTLEKWERLRPYSPEDAVRYQLKTFHRQFQLSSKTKTACVNNLIVLLEQTYPGLRGFFDSPAREDGRQKWVDFADTFWHVDCVRKGSLNAFTERYRKWRKRRGYNFSQAKAAGLYEGAKGKIALISKSDVARTLVKEAVARLNAVSRTVETYRAEMGRLASQLPEYETVMGMYAVGESTGPQLMAEIGDIRRFASQKSLVSFAGSDPVKHESGDSKPKSAKASKRGSPYLRKTLFVIMITLLQNKPADNPVYQFLDKKRSEGKPYYVYMTAGFTKFLRVCYGKVRDCLREKGLWDKETVNPVKPC